MTRRRWVLVLVALVALLSSGIGPRSARAALVPDSAEGAATVAATDAEAAVDDRSHAVRPDTVVRRTDGGVLLAAVLVAAVVLAASTAMGPPTWSRGEATRLVPIRVASPRSRRGPPLRVR